MSVLSRLAADPVSSKTCNRLLSGRSNSMCLCRQLQPLTLCALTAPRPLSQARPTLQSSLLIPSEKVLGGHMRHRPVSLMPYPGIQTHEEAEVAAM